MFLVQHDAAWKMRELNIYFAIYVKNYEQEIDKLALNLIGLS